MASELTVRAIGIHTPQVSPMTAAQRAALHELVHRPATLRASPWARPARAGDVVWAAVLALLLAACVVSPLEDLGYLPANDPAAASVAARPHVDERVAYAPVAGAGVIR